MPSGTKFCLLDFTDFPAGTSITVPSNNDYRVGDPVSFSEEGSAKLDTALTAGTTYYVTTKTDTSIDVSATDGGAAITLNGDGGIASATGPIATLDTIVGGTGYTDGNYAGVSLQGGTGVGATADITVAGNEVTVVTIVSGGLGYTVGDDLTADDADIGGGGGTGFTVPVLTVTASNTDTPGEANHIKVSYAEYESVCQVATWSMDLTREEIDVTSLPCGTQSAASSKYAPFRTYVPGYVDASGTMTVHFTEDQGTMANRLIQNSLLKSQDGAMAKLYISTGPDDANSLYIETPIIILGFSTSVTPGEATTAELNFRVSEPEHVFGLDLV
jgi:hypothetical protein